jgi:tetratricopeptide (TPR) repeat protein
MIGPTPAGAGSAFAVLVEHLLFGDGGPGATLEEDAGTRSRVARQVFSRALDSVFAWNLEAADSAFNTATRADPQFTEALLWLGQVRSWEGAQPATWQSAAERAAAGRDRLSPRDQLLSDALVALSRGQPERACPIWRHGTELHSGDFVVWYGLGSCLSSDRAVLRDDRSPSHWAFRTSYAEATRAYVRAFRLLPSIHRSLAAGSYLSVRRLLWTSTDNLRSGSAVAPDTGMFVAYCAWQRDTLAFIPYRLSELPELRRSRTLSLAVGKERELFHDIATAWVTAYPKSADALDALALSLALLGNPAALDTMR